MIILHSGQIGPDIRKQSHFGHARDNPVAPSVISASFVLASPNIVGSKLGLRMTTLHEETSNPGNQLSTPARDEDEEKSDADYSEYDPYQVVQLLKS